MLLLADLDAGQSSNPDTCRVMDRGFREVTGSSLINRGNGLMIMLAALQLMLQLGAIPFTNAMPAWTILLQAIGLLMAGQNISTLFS